MLLPESTPQLKLMPLTELAQRMLMMLVRLGQSCNPAFILMRMLAQTLLDSPSPSQGNLQIMLMMFVGSRLWYSNP